MEGDAEGSLSNLGSALAGLGDKLPGEQALAGAQRIVRAMEKPTSAYSLDFLGGTLVTLAANLPEDQALDFARRIVPAMERTADGLTLAYFGSALGGLGNKLPGVHALAGARPIVDAIKKGAHANKWNRNHLDNAFGALVVGMETEDIASVLKSTICVGTTLQRVLAELEKKSGQEFDGNLWNAIAWLEGQGIDVKNVPRYSIISTK